MIKITKAETRPGLKVDLRFSDGVQGVVDLSDLAGRGVFRAWNDRESFEAVAITPSGDLEWPGGLDLCADSLYLRVTGKPVEAVLPGLQKTRTDA